MAKGAIEALEADRERVLELAGQLSVEQWQAPSGCAGWRVQDVVSHMGALFWMVVDPGRLPDAGDRLAEDAQELFVESRRGWSVEQAVEDYREVSRSALDALAGLEGQDFEMPLGDLGTYPAHLVANAFAFDHFTHIRADLYSPRGPLGGPGWPTPPVDEPSLAPALDWIDAALPQQNRSLIDSMGTPVQLVVEGPGGRTLSIGAPAGGSGTTTVTSEGLPFVRWITQRGAWDELGVKASGDEGVLALARRLKVF